MLLDSRMVLVLIGILAGLVTTTSCRLGGNAVNPNLGADGTRSVPRPGTLDVTFNGAGYVTLDTPDVMLIRDVQVDSQSRILLSFRLSSTDPLDSGSFKSDWGFARVTDSGAQDMSFNAGTGYLRWDFAGGDNYEAGEALIADGSGWLAPGYVRKDTGNFDLLVARLLDDGTLDSTYGNLSGMFHHVPALDERETASGGFRLADGSLLIAGQGGSATATTSLYKLTPAGALDAAFGTDGVKSHPNISGAGGTGDYPGPLSLASSGDRALMPFYTSPTPGPSLTGVARFLLDGDLDPAFGTGAGKTLITPPVGLSYCNPAFFGELASGHLALAGMCVDGTGAQFAPFYHRLGPNGAIDAAFGGSVSLLLTAIWPELTTNAKSGVYFAAIDSQDRLVLSITDYSGSAVGDPYRVLIARLNSDGTPDDSFGEGGLVALHSGTYVSGIGRSADVSLDSDGRILVAGPVANEASEIRLRLWRLVP